MKSAFRSWMLPEGVVEALPQEATIINRLEQRAFEVFSGWGYQPLRPPILEYANTFLAHDSDGRLAEQTVQFKDQKSGQQLGLRADITPQISRIDSHYLSTEKVARYAYVGEVLRSYTTGHGGIRNPSLAGIELFGSQSWQADVEAVSLLIEYFHCIDLPTFVIELGSIDIVAELLMHYKVKETYFPAFFDAFAKKDNEKIFLLCQQSQLPEPDAYQICELTALYGDIKTLKKAEILYESFPYVLDAIARLSSVARQLQSNYPNVQFSFDLSDVHGYGYHNGLIFSAYIEGVWQSVARGGRYDFLGGRSESGQYRPSIGFNCHLNLLAKHANFSPTPKRIIACHMARVNEVQHISIQRLLPKLRAQGDVVICLFDDEIPSVARFTHQLVWQNQDWSIVALGDL